MQHYGKEKAWTGPAESTESLGYRCGNRTGLTWRTVLLPGSVRAQRGSDPVPGHEASNPPSITRKGQSLLAQQPGDAIPADGTWLLPPQYRDGSEMSRREGCSGWVWCLLALPVTVALWFPSGRAVRVEVGSSCTVRSWTRTHLAKELSP